MKNVRYYWDTDLDNCLVRASNSHYIYGYEYLGASPRLVITPLTVSSHDVHNIAGPTDENCTIFRTDHHMEELQ